MTSQPLLITPAFTVALSTGAVSSRVACEQLNNVVTVRLERADGSALSSQYATTLSAKAFRERLPKHPMAQAFYLLDLIGLRVAPIAQPTE